MADAPPISAQQNTPPITNSGTAPFIYFDAALAYGVLAGAIQIEIASRVLTPREGTTAVDVQFVCTGHIRCSPAAAVHLRDALTKTLEMLNQPQEVQPVAASRLN